MSYNYYHPEWYDQEGDYNDTRRAERLSAHDPHDDCIHSAAVPGAVYGELHHDKYVEVPVTHTDTLIQTKVQRDSIWKHDDSIFRKSVAKGGGYHIPGYVPMAYASML